MVKRLFGLLMLLVCVFGLKAQNQQMPTLPLNPQVIHGTLPNGLNYYVLSNKEPAGRANFYIAQKVGSALETPQQLGLAHFLEHMAFNGTKNFPGKNMLEYLQHNGLRFGIDINAYTNFDETVYRINNVPTNNAALMDSCLLVLHDWSCDLLLEDKEIDEERGVIHEEWRQRNDVNTRMYKNLLPQIYDEYQYTQTPIGTMEVVLNFPYQDLRDYYHTWYRPDQQGIIVVGDFDAKEMAEKIVKLFSPIPMPENAKPRTYPAISDNKELRYATFQDPEVQSAFAELSFKSDATPFEMRNTEQYYVMNEYIAPLICEIVNTRLREMAQQPDCPFIRANLRISQFWITKNKDAVTLKVTPKAGVPIQQAFDVAFSEFVRACRTGVTTTELDRAKEELLADLEKYYNEREKIDSHDLGQIITRHFIDNEPYLGAEMDYQVGQMILAQLPAEVINQVMSQLITEDNQVLSVVMPQQDGYVMPTKEEMDSIIKNAMAKQYEAYVDNVVTEPLIAKMPKKGSVKKQEELPQFGATVLTLSNGARVIVKTTDFASDEILFTATAPFGMNAFLDQPIADLQLASNAAESSKLGNFDVLQLQKALAGKKVGSTFSLGSTSVGFSGISRVKDLETLMQIIYLQFTSMNPDKKTYDAQIARLATSLKNADKNPNRKFSNEFRKSLFNAHVTTTPMTLETLDNADYDRMLKLVKKTLSNAADYDFIFVGNVDVATLKPLLEQYIAALPGKPGKKSGYKNELVYQAQGIVNNFFDFPMESPQVKEIVIFTGNDAPYTVANNVKIDIMSQILDMIYIRTLREEIGGTYGAGVQAFINPRTNEWTFLYVYDTGADTKKQLEERAIADLEDLIKNGARPEDFNKVKEATLSKFDMDKKTNGYWLGTLITYSELGYDDYTEYYNTLKNLTLEDLNAFMKQIKMGPNRIHVTLNGVKAEK